MTNPEFSWQQSQEGIAQQLTQEAQDLIHAESEPVMRGRMIVAAVEEGLPIGADEVLNNLARIPNEYDDDAEETSPFKHKDDLIQQTVAAFARQGRFADADTLIAFALELEPHTYLESVSAVIKQGYGGPDNAYFHLSKERLCELAIAPSHYDLPERPAERVGDIMVQRDYLGGYLKAIARSGINFLEFGSEHNFIYNTVIAMYDELADEDAPKDLSQIQGYLAAYAKAYMEGGHAELALIAKDMIQDHTFRAKACLDILDRTEDPAMQSQLLLELSDLEQQIAGCQGECGYELCTAGAVRRNFQLHITKQRLRLNAIDLRQAEEQADRENEWYHPLELAAVYLELYRRSGEEEARSGCLQFFNDITDYSPEIVSRQLLAVAEADTRSGRTIPLEGEDIPQVCWEIESIFWGADRYVEATLDESMPEINGLFDTVMAGDKDRSETDPNAIGPLSLEYGEPGVIEDLENCLKQRDRAHVVLATLTAKQGALRASQKLLSKVEGAEEKVRGMLAVAHALRHD